MENDLARAQHYRHLADAMRRSGREEKAPKRQKELLDLALQYERLADNLIAKSGPDKASSRSGER